MGLHGGLDGPDRRRLAEISGTAHGLVYSAGLNQKEEEKKKEEDAIKKII